MGYDATVKQRFAQLVSKASGVQASFSEPTLYGTELDDEQFHQWATSVLNLLRGALGEETDHYLQFHDAYKAFKGYTENLRQFLKLKGILAAAKEDYEGGYLFKLESLVTADVFADFLEMADYLLQEHYKDPAAVLVGGVLEEHLRRLCQHNSIPITRTDSRGRTVPVKADAMNAELARQRVYHKLDQKSVTAWLDLRNKAAHGDYDAYNEEQVRNMLEGVREFAKRTLP